LEKLGVDAIYAKQAEWREQNRPYLQQKSRKRRLSKRAMCLVAAARIRARKKKIVFNLDAADIAALQAVIDAGRCELSGVPFTLEGPRSATSPSLDRIEADKGYVRGNVRVICHALNAGLGDWGEAELRRIVTAWVAS
jgi:hypothetical protein